MEGMADGRLLILLVIVLSGLIAYIGDQIGMKAGKKRISIFGLRPRYSSIIITVITGILIASLSIGILLLTYSGLRQALFNINQVMTRLERLNTQLEVKDTELEIMQEEIGAKTEELELLQENKEELEQELYITRQELEEAEESLVRASRAIESLEEEREGLNQLVSELKQERQDLEDRTARLNQNIEELEERYDLLKEDAEALAFAYSDLYSTYRDEDIVYQKGDIIYSEVLEGGRPEEETIEAVTEFLNRANEAAAARPIRVDEETGQALGLQEEDVWNIARLLYNMDEGKRVIVRLEARFNVSPGDWLLADFLPLIEDTIVFEEGQLIAEHRLRGSLTEADIEEELQKLLFTVNERAVDNGFLPDIHGDVGILSLAELFKLFSEIDEGETPLQIDVYAAEEIWRQNTLDGSNLEFTIEEIDEIEASEEVEAQQ